MRRTVTFSVGIVIFAAASAIGKSDQPNSNAEAVTAESAAFGQLSVENLTAEQRALLQSKFRYWTSSGMIASKAPI